MFPDTPQTVDPHAHFELGSHPTQRQTSLRTPKGLAIIEDLIPLSTREAVAANVLTDGLRLAAMANDTDPRVRQALAKNPALPSAILQQLLHDPHPQVRASAQRHADIKPVRLVSKPSKPLPSSKTPRQTA